MPIEMSRHAVATGLRLGGGVGVTFGAGLLFGWPLAYLGAVFAALLLQAPAPVPTAAATRIIVTCAGLGFGSLLLAMLLAPYPAATLLALSLGTVLALRHALQGGNLLVVVFALIAVLLVPYLVRSSPALAMQVVPWLPINLALAFAASALAFAAVPAPPDAPAPPAAPATAPYDPERRLLRMSLTTLPLVYAFYLWEAGSILTMIFVAILATQLTGATSATATVARQTMAGNVAGGLAAVMAYETTVIAPLLPVAILCGLAICLVLAAQVAAGRAVAATALTTALILYGGALGPISDGADTKMVTRLYQIGAALVYLLGAFVLLDRLLPERLPDRPSDRPARSRLARRRRRVSV